MSQTNLKPTVVNDMPDDEPDHVSQPDSATRRRNLDGEPVDAADPRVPAAEREERIGSAGGGAYGEDRTQEERSGR